MVLSMPRPYKHPKTGVYWYRQRVPSSLKEVATGKVVAVTIDGRTSRPKIGSHLTVSLDTKEVAKAKVRGNEAQSQFDLIWQSLSDNAPVRLTNEQTVALAGEVYRDFKLLEADPGNAELWSKVQAENEIALKTRSAPNPLTIRATNLDLVDLRFGPFVDAVLAKHQITAEPASRAAVLKHTANALQASAELLQRRANGDYSSDTHADRFPPVSTLEPVKRKRRSKASTEVDTNTLTGLLAHRQLTQSHKEATFSMYRGCLRQFSEFIGHEDAFRITKGDVRRWRDHLIGRGLATKTINDQYLASLKSTLAHGVKEFDLPANVAASMRDERDAPAPSGSKGYSQEQAKTILEATFKGSRKNLAIPYQRAIFWVPWICAYTGLRVSEITQFQGRNLREKGGVPYMMITPEDGSTKGNNAWTTGIHPHLIELGLLEMFRAIGDGPAFYTPYPHGTDLRTLNDHRAKSAGDKIAEWVRDEVGITAPGNRPSHAWRHLFTTLTRNYKVDKEARDYMLGSRSKTDAREGYGDWEPEVIDHEIRKLPKFSVTDTHWRPPTTKVAPEAQKALRPSK